MFKKFICLILLINLLISSSLLAQTNIDSLILVTETSNVDSTVTKAFLDLCWAFKASEPKKALIYGDKALNLSRNNKFEYLEAMALKNIGVIHLFQGNYDQSENFFNAALKNFIKLNNQKGLSSCYNNLGLVFEQKGDFDMASSNYQKSLEINEKINNKSGVASSLTNIGNIFQKQGNYSVSIEYYIKVLNIREELNEKIGIADALNNIGALYEKQNAFNEAMKNYQKALSMYIGIDEKPKSAMVLSNIGYVLRQQKQYNEALHYYNQAKEIRQEFGDKQGMAQINLNIGYVYSDLNKLDLAYRSYTQAKEIFNEIGGKYGIILTDIALGEYYLEINKYSKAIDQLESLIKSKEILLSDLSQVYHIISQAYSKTNNYPLAYKYLSQHLVLKDSLENEQNVKKILQIQLKYDFDKKQKELEIIREKNRLNDMAMLNNRKLVIFILILCLIGFMLIGLFIYRSYRVKKQDNFLLELQKKEIQEKNEKLQLFHEELISQNENLEIQKNLVIQHRDKIAEQNQKITDSIQYAKRIQNSMLPPMDHFSDCFKDYFILFKPKDIVSGDFYWLKNTEKYLFVAVADCTGHGVPGAFMSLLGISFFNEIIESGLSSSTTILSKIREKIKVSLRQQYSKQETKDGMDISLCVINKHSKEISFAGAYHSLLILKSNQDNIELVEIRGDKMPVGTHFKEDKEFSEHLFKIENGDKFYMYTDGFIDQFGGAYDRKFLPVRFKEIISKTGSLSMEDQKDQLDTNLKKWMDKNEQVDDILVLGFTLDL